MIGDLLHFYLYQLTMRRTKYHIIRSLKELDILIDSCIKVGYACVDFETNAQPIYNKDFKPTILSITFQPGFGCSIPLNHPETKNYTEKGWNWKKALKRFGRKVIENPKVTKIAWNAKFDFQIFQLYKIYYRGTLLDGMLAKYILNEERPHGLKDMVSRYLPDAAGYEADKGFDSIPWDKKPLDDLCKYGCQDTDYTFRLMIFFENKLIEGGLYSLFRNMIMTASRVLQTVEANGLYIDRKFNKKLLEEYEPKIKNALDTCLNLPKVKKFQNWYNQQKIDKYINTLEKEIDELPQSEVRKIRSREMKISQIRAGIFTTKKEQELVRQINLNSNTDLPILMFSKEGLNMKPIKETESGKPSTDEESLIELRLKVKNPESPKAIFLDSLMELRGLEKMYKTYILGWSEKVQDDDCLHGRFQIQGTTSGRLCLARGSSILTNFGLLPIERLCPENEGYQDLNGNIKALTHTGSYQPIVRGINKGYEEMFKVTLDNGNTITCTAGHKFLTNNGWKSLKEINYEKDQIACEIKD